MTSSVKTYGDERGRGGGAGWGGGEKTFSITFHVLKKYFTERDRDRDREGEQTKKHGQNNREEREREKLYDRYERITHTPMNDIISIMITCKWRDGY